ncbi:MAG: hypothetical protein HRU24_00510 [Gammaproteobacteria bacterium]|nr:hypothetical protein [Gammaproteobacteria bacterium]
MVGHELFEKIIDIIESKSSGVNSTFRPASARMDAIAHLGAELVLSAKDADLGDFEE